MAIVLKPETEEKLRQLAQRQGQDAQNLADAWLAESIARHEQEFEANIAAIQEGLDAMDAGRMRPAAEFFAEHRRRFPDPEPSA